jgi:hypothetical protein
MELTFKGVSRDYAWYVDGKLFMRTLTVHFPKQLEGFLGQGRNVVRKYEPQEVK